MPAVLYLEAAHGRPSSFLSFASVAGSFGNPSHLCSARGKHALLSSPSASPRRRPGFRKEEPLNSLLQDTGLPKFFHARSHLLAFVYFFLIQKGTGVTFKGLVVERAPLEQPCTFSSLLNAPAAVSLEPRSCKVLCAFNMFPLPQNSSLPLIKQGMPLLG